MREVDRKFFESVIEKLSSDSAKLFETLYNIFVSEGAERVESVINRLIKGTEVSEITQARISPPSHFEKLSIPTVIGMLRPSHLTVEGFRAFNTVLDFSIKKPVVLLYGPNGTGKSSYFEAEQWVLRGKIDEYAKYEFNQEDAFANAFHPDGKVSVTLTMQGDDRKVLVKRQRNRGRKTNIDTEICINGTEMGSNEAIYYLEELLKLNPDDFAPLCHLQQQTLRRLVDSTPKERGEIIEYFLGLEKYGTLAESLEKSGRAATKRAKKIWELKEHEEEKISAALSQLKQQYSESYEEAKVEGIIKVESDVKLLTSFELFENAKRGLYVLAKKLNESIEEIETPEITLESIREAVSVLDEINGELTPKIDEKYSIKKLWNEILRLKTKREKLKELEQRIEDRKASLRELTKELNELRSSKITEEYESKLKNLETQQNKLNELYPAFTRFKLLTSEHKKLQQELEKITTKFGTQESVSSEIDAKKKQLKQIKEDLSKQNLLARLLSLACDYLESADVDFCPVCQTEKEREPLLDQISSRLQELKSMAIDQLSKNEKALKSKVEELTEQRNLLKKKKTNLANFKKDLLELKDEFSDLELFQEISEKEFQKEIGKLQNERGLLQNQLNEIKTKSSQLEKDIKRFKKEIEKDSKTRDNTVGKLSRLLGVSLENVDKLINSRIEEKEDKTKKIEDDRLEATKLQRKIINDLQNLEKLNKLIELKERIDRGSVEELKESKKKIDQMRKDFVSLEDLSKRLKETSRAISVSIMDVAMNEIDSLRNTMSEFYGALVEHPFFKEFMLDAKTVGGRREYFLKVTNPSEGMDSHVRTRLSQGQINCTAIACFLALAIKALDGHNCGIIIVDEPEQSLDAYHQRKLADLITKITPLVNEKGACLQIAVTNEDFFNLLKSNLGEEAQIIKFKEWSENTGPVVSSLEDSV